jgi:hypothetical protein
MAESSGILSNLLAPVARDLSGQGTAREAVRPRAAQSTPPSQETDKAVTRLNKVIKTGESLRRDVPRGYYLDITV